MLNYDESLPMSGTCVQSVKTLTKRVYILMAVQLSHCRNSLGVRGLKLCDTPKALFKVEPY